MSINVSNTFKCPADFKQNTAYCVHCPNEDQCSTQLALDATVCKITKSDFDDVFSKVNLINSLYLSAQTPCPCPPETAKPSLVAVDGGIFFDNGLSIKNILCGHCLNATPEPELKEFLGWCHDCFYTA